MKKKTAVFIDYESWFYGMMNLHNELPKVDEVLEEIERENEVVLKKSFGNLPVSDNVSKKEEEKLAEFGYMLEKTFEGNVKDDLTDFVVVDNIYRTLMQHPEIEKYIILSGDAHYLQVVRTLRDLGKEVEIWAVVGTLSAVFNNYKTRPIYPTHINQEVIEKILEEVYISDSLVKRMTSTGIIKSVCDKHGYDENTVKRSLQILICKGVIKEVHYLNYRGKKTQWITANGEKVALG